jgi:alkylation response protein AidB-like acyl-CoA dehydrogenase
MDLAFTPEEQQFREDIRAWVGANLPADIAHKVHNALHLTRDDMQRWAKILGKKGWLGHAGPRNLAVRAGIRCKNTCLKKNALWPVRRVSFPLAQ